MRSKELFLKERKRDTENAKAVLRKNRNKIYKLSVNKYPYLYRAIRGEIKDFLLDIISFWLSRNCCIRAVTATSRPLFFLGTYMGTYMVRKKSTTSVTNRWLNYLCAIGLLSKEKQVIHYAWNRRHLVNVTGVNKKLLAYKDFKIKPINTFKVFEYTSDVLQKCDERAKKLLDKKITQGNISYLKLAENGLLDIATEVYQERRKGSEEKKQREFGILITFIDDRIAAKGFTTKSEIYQDCGIEKKELDKLFVIYRDILWNDRSYKRPTEIEKKKYGLNSNGWIIQNRT